MINLPMRSCKHKIWKYPSKTYLKCVVYTKNGFFSRLGDDGLVLKQLRCLVIRRQLRRSFVFWESSKSNSVGQRDWCGSRDDQGAYNNLVLSFFNICPVYLRRIDDPSWILKCIFVAYFWLRSSFNNVALDLKKRD